MPGREGGPPSSPEELDQERGHQLLDDETRQRLPPLYSGEKQGLDAVAQHPQRQAEEEGLEAQFFQWLGQRIPKTAAQEL